MTPGQNPPACVVLFSTGTAGSREISAHLDHYEQLKDMLDHGETGWVELRLNFADGKAMVRVERIVSLMLATEGWCKEDHEWEKLNTPKWD